MKVTTMLITVLFAVCTMQYAYAEENGLICPALYLSCDGPLANDNSRAALHEIASKIAAENCFAEEAMRCYGSVASADTRKAEAVALRRKVASLKRQIQQLKKSLVK
jgi:hypothetical protein